MLKRCRVAKVKRGFSSADIRFKFDLFEFSAAILEEGLFGFIAS